MSTERPFYLAKTAEGTCVAYDTEAEAIELEGFYEAEFVYHVCPDEMRVREISDILAGKFWALHGERGALVPNAYLPHLADEIYEVEFAPHVGRGLGVEFLHHPERF